MLALTTSPTIVIPAFNRGNELSQLLNQINSSVFPDGRCVNLIISIDGNATDAVVAVASDFVWKRGKKRVVRHKQNLGLKNHILKCGDLTQELGPIIVIEEDLLVSPGFYHYAVQTLSSKAAADPRLAGISLYSYRTNEVNLVRFYPILDGHDNYYLQFPSSWGQIWTANQWHKFKLWYSANRSSDLEKYLTNKKIAAWGGVSDSSWKKYFAAYMAAEDKYVLFPRESLTDCPGHKGTNHSHASHYYRTPLAVKPRKNYEISTLEESLAVYDQNFELAPRLVKQANPGLKAYDFQVKLTNTEILPGIKPLRIVHQKRTRTSYHSWGNILFPAEANILLNVPGDEISLIQREDHKPTCHKRSVIECEKHFGIRDCLSFLLYQLTRRIKNLFPKSQAGQPIKTQN